MPMGMAMNKGLTFRTGQTHVNRGRTISSVSSRKASSIRLRHHPYRKSLNGPDMYKVFRDKQDSCIKVVLKP